jgi:hypothetical protein
MTNLNCPQFLLDSGEAVEVCIIVGRIGGGGVGGGFLFYFISTAFQAIMIDDPASSW